MNLLDRVQCIQSYICSLKPSEKETFDEVIRPAFEDESKVSFAEIKTHLHYILSMYEYDTTLYDDLDPEAPFDYDYFFLSYEDFKEAIDHCKDPDAEVKIHNLVWIRVNNIKEVLLGSL